MPYIRRRARIDTQFREIAAEICRPVLFHAFPFMAVMAYKHKISLPFCFFNGADDPGRVLFVHGRNRPRLFPGRDCFKADVPDQVPAGQRLVETLFFQQHTVGIHFRLVYDLTQCVQFFRQHLVNRLIPQHIGSRTSQHIPSRVGSHAPLIHGRGNTDNGHPSLGQVQILRLGRFFQIDTAACMYDARCIQMFLRSQDAAKIPIDRMIIRPGVQVKAQVLQVLQHRRTGAGPCPAAYGSGIHFKIMQQNLKIGKTHIKAAEIFL